MISLQLQQIIFYSGICLVFVAFITFLYIRSKQLEHDRLNGFEPVDIRSGFYALLDSESQALDPYAFNPVLVDVMRLEDTCRDTADQPHPEQQWYLAAKSKGGEVALLKPDRQECLVVNTNGMLRSEPVGTELPERSSWVVTKIGKGWSLQHVITGQYLSWSECSVGLKSMPVRSCVLKLKKFERNDF